MKMDTPVVHLTNEELDSVYEPSEDSFLLIDALEMDLKKIIINKPLMCLEIGIGSGVVITSLAMALKKYCSSYYVGIDINPQPCKVTKRTSDTNKVDINVIQMDLFNNMYTRGIFDIIIFNPPYVVTDALEVFDDSTASKVWAGGYDGRQVMNKVFPRIPHYLSKKGLFYLLVIKENNPHDIIQLFKDMNMIGSIIIERKIRGEHLYVLRFEKSN